MLILLAIINCLLITILDVSYNHNALLTIYVFLQVLYLLSDIKKNSEKNICDEIGVSREKELGFALHISVIFLLSTGGQKPHSPPNLYWI